MQVDIHPTAEDSYARTLIQRGCPSLLASLAGKALARLGEVELTAEEQALITRAYSHLTH